VLQGGACPSRDAFLHCSRSHGRRVEPPRDAWPVTFEGGKNLAAHPDALVTGIGVRGIVERDHVATAKKLDDIAPPHV
jgi:hypothetical protein